MNLLYILRYFYYILQFYVNFFFLYNPIVAISMGRHVTLDIFYNISCVDR